MHRTPLAPLQVRIAEFRAGQYDRPGAAVLRENWWDQAVAGKKHITLVPPPACGKEAAPYFPFSLLAGDHDMTVNTGYLARKDDQATSAYCDRLQAEIQAGRRRMDTLYIVSDERLDEFLARSGPRVKCTAIEGYNACESAPTALADSGGFRGP
jgi:hypothetical protein